jgi:hypothetical protein
MYGPSLSPDDRSPAGSSLEKSGGATTGAIGFTRNSLSTPFKMNDRRSIGRTEIIKGALLFFGKKAGIQSCTVRDVTNLGAGIRSQDLTMMPLDFELSFDGFRTSRKCRLIWREDEFFGVAFES